MSVSQMIRDKLAKLPYVCHAMMFSVISNIYVKLKKIIIGIKDQGLYAGKD